MTSSRRAQGRVRIGMGPCEHGSGDSGPLIGCESIKHLCENRLFKEDCQIWGSHSGVTPSGSGEVY
jgi:hypothetical protein